MRGRVRRRRKEKGVERRSCHGGPLLVSENGVEEGEHEIIVLLNGGTGLRRVQGREREEKSRE